MSEDWRIGDHRVISDISGRKIWASESRKQWNGMIVHESEYEPRHPLDTIRARRESPGVQNARPQPIDTFIGPLTTLVATAALAGATTLVVESSGRMSASDRISVMLDNGDTFRAAIATVVDATTIAMDTPLPGNVSVGKMVIDNSAMALPTLP